MGGKKTDEQRKAVPGLGRKRRPVADTCPARLQLRSVPLPRDYAAFLEEIKTRIRKAQIRVALSANRELIQLYWDLGGAIVQKQRESGWGTKVIDHLADDLQQEFPGVSGFSRTNVYRMRALYLAYGGSKDFVPQAVGQSVRGSVPQVVGRIRVPNLPDVVANIPWGWSVT
jgi:hypothetical protein